MHRDSSLQEKGWMRYFKTEHAASTTFHPVRGYLTSCGSMDHSRAHLAENLNIMCHVELYRRIRARRYVTLRKKLELCTIVPVEPGESQFSMEAESCKML